MNMFGHTPVSVVQSELRKGRYISSISLPAPEKLLDCHRGSINNVPDFFLGDIIGRRDDDMVSGTTIHRARPRVETDIERLSHCCLVSAKPWIH